MRRTIFHLVIASGLLAGGAVRVSGQPAEIIGYYPSWKWDAQDSAARPERIPFDRLTMIDYAFFYPTPEGRLVGRDTAGDAWALRGERGGARLVDLAHARGVKVLLSVGGWEDSGNFPAVAADSAARARFAGSCVDAMRRYRFDGIDIDWEFPGLADHHGTPADRQNFTMLLRSIRDSLDGYGRQTQRFSLLTAALPARPSGPVQYDMAAIAGILDMLNVMTYDLNGSWDPASGHNAPLYAPDAADTLRNIDAVFRAYTGMYGVPAAKLNIGIPFYAHSYTQCTVLGAPHGGADTKHFSAQGILFADVERMRPSLVEHWDARAMVPWYVHPAWGELFSCENERSVALKAEYLRAHGGRGVIIWEITGDALRDGRHPLLSVVAERLRAVRR